MKIHSLCIAKNEADIIAQTLLKALNWSDYIYIVDNDSSDRTWDIILELSQKHPQIIPCKQDSRAYFDSMRGEMFNHFRDRSEPGDWWCKLDADEFYIDDPRVFLGHIPIQYQAVWAASFQYYFTDEDLKQYQRNPSAFADDVPVEKKCRFYRNDWSENRFFRYDPKIVWDTKDKVRSWPYFGAIYPERIRLKHFQYRSPQQIKQRLATRLEAAARDRSSQAFIHETQLVSDSEASYNSLASSCALAAMEELWKKRIEKADELIFDRLDGRYEIREDLMPSVPKSYFPPLENRIRNLKRYVNSTTINRLMSLAK